MTQIPETQTQSLSPAPEESLDLSLEETSGTWEELFYPSSDGKPMAETDTHVEQIVLLKSSLDLYYQEREDVSVSANILLYYQEGDVKKCLSPDVMVTLGVPRGKRRSFFLWKEGKAPDVVFEITSDSSVWYDVGEKMALYEKMRVKEYFVFHPLAKSLTLAKALRGYRLSETGYQKITPGEENLVSEILQLELAIHEGVLRLRNPKTRQWISTLPEEARARQLAEQKAGEESRARQLAEQKAGEEARARQLAEQKIRELQKKLKSIKK